MATTTRWTLKNTILLVLVLLLAALVCLAALYLPPLGRSPAMMRFEEEFSASQLPIQRSILGSPAKGAAQIANVQIVDLDGDGLPDVLACDAKFGNILWYRQAPRGRWTEHVLNQESLPPMAHATVIDLDKDDDLDIVVSVLGKSLPTEQRIGRVVWLENKGQNTFVTHILLHDVRRVADAQGGDVDNDGDIDLVVAEFGHIHGNIWYLENIGADLRSTAAAGVGMLAAPLGQGLLPAVAALYPGRAGRIRFREKLLAVVPGTIHVPVGDFDDDGDLDVVALVSQDEEAVWVFENIDGKTLRKREQPLFAKYNFDLGSAGLVPCDLDKDGDTDFLLAAGDNLEIIHNYPQPWHGCFWLENRGKWNFVAHHIARLGGAYAAAPGDLDGDGDVDVVLVSLFNDWSVKNAASIVWLENDGKQSFKTWQIAASPIHLATVACGDLNADGRADIVAGCFHLIPPFERLGRIPLWLSVAKN